jgi:hypothetical protein
METRGTETREDAARRKAEVKASSNSERDM